MSQWAKIIKERQEGGKKVDEFCKERGLNRNAFYYWQRKLRRSKRCQALELMSYLHLLGVGDMGADHTEGQRCQSLELMYGACHWS
ncbi:MAG: transposase [Bacteroidales bacterium]|nr:transposase [Bacteroidales bacterium]